MDHVVCPGNADPSRQRQASVDDLDQRSEQLRPIFSGSSLAILSNIGGAVVHALAPWPLVPHNCKIDEMPGGFFEDTWRTIKSGPPVVAEYSIAVKVLRLAGQRTMSLRSGIQG